jgi:hypothetical protein
MSTMCKPVWRCEIVDGLATLCRARFVPRMSLVPNATVMMHNPRPSFEALPSWLSRLPEIPPTPIRASRPPEEGLLRRALANPRLPLHVVILAIVLGIGAAAAAGSARTRHTSQSQAEMSAFAERKVAELRAFVTLRALPADGPTSPLAAGGSLSADVPGYYDEVEGSAGRRFRRRWAIEVGQGGHRRIAVRIVPTTRAAGNDSLDVSTVMAHR